MVVYELYDGVYCRRIDNLEKEKEIRQKKEVRFFELYDIDVDLGEDVKLSEIKKHIHSSPVKTGDIEHQKAAEYIFDFIEVFEVEE
jgi:activator of HSP90 ATPase